MIVGAPLGDDTFRMEIVSAPDAVSLSASLNENVMVRGDVPGLHRTLTGLDRATIEMREVSPFGGLLPDEERLQVLRMAG